MELSYSMWTNVWMDGRTDMTKLIVAFRNFANAPKNCSLENTIWKTGLEMQHNINIKTDIKRPYMEVVNSVS
jgi:hypothetical protein